MRRSEIEKGFERGGMEIKSYTTVREMVLESDYIETQAEAILLPLAPQFTWANVDFAERRIMLKGKGQKTRFVPMNDTLMGVFTALKNEGQDPPFPYHPDTVTHRTSHYLKLAGIEGANLHSLRKTFGSLLLQNGLADLYTVSRLLGHASYRTSERYYIETSWMKTIVHQ